MYPPDEGGSGGREGDREVLPGHRVIGGGGPPDPPPPWIWGGGGVGDLGAAQRRLLIDGAAAAAGAGAADCRYVGVLLCFFLAAVLIRVLT